jgi:hypothetical protein
MKTRTITNFVKLSLALLQGNTQQANAIKNEQIIKNNIESQICLQKGRLPLLESNVDDSVRSYQLALLNVTVDSEGGFSNPLITSYANYDNTLDRARNAKLSAEGELKALTKSIDLLKGDLNTLDTLSLSDFGLVEEA